MTCNSGCYIKDSFRSAWYAISTIILAGLIAGFVLPEETLSGLTPECELKAKYGTECSACGLTRGFMGISRGDYEKADVLNRASLPLYGLFSLNSILFLYFAAMEFLQRKKPK
jgi:Protein of unknown function (DUF2752)